MMTLANVRDFLKTIINAEHFYIGRLDNKQDKSIGVYTLKPVVSLFVVLAQNYLMML